MSGTPCERLLHRACHPRRRRNVNLVFSGSITDSAPTGTAAKRDPAQTGAIRQWAANNDYEINDRGRIPAAIVDAFKAPP